MSKYWDDFERRITETTKAVEENINPPLRRVCLHITSKCNFNCNYCNEIHKNKTLPKSIFTKIVEEYSQMGGGILHITGGEPSTVKWLSKAIIDSPENIVINFNTNAFKMLEPINVYNRINRMKISLDTCNPSYFNGLVHKKRAFEVIVENLQKLQNINKTKDISITYTMTKQNYKNIPDFLEFYYDKLPYLYAIFFSTYKGNNPDFVFTDEDIVFFWENIVPKMKDIFIQNKDTESLWLFKNSYNKNTLQAVIRFPENTTTQCYLSMSELVIDENGDTWRCSHLFRDKVIKSGLNIKDFDLDYIHQNLILEKSPKCLYGCNLKLVNFNKQVENNLQNYIKN
jgi:sulfatase maturation enzyme AslB (radical SAM superfamily)